MKSVVIGFDVKDGRQVSAGTYDLDKGQTNLQDVSREDRFFAFYGVIDGQNYLAMLGGHAADQFEVPSSLEELADAGFKATKKPNA